MGRVYQEILRLIDDVGEPRATTLRRQWEAGVVDDAAAVLHRPAPEEADEARVHVHLDVGELDAVGKGEALVARHAVARDRQLGLGSVSARGEPFPLRQDRLKRELAGEGLSECDPGRYTAVARGGGRLRRVVRLPRRAVETLLVEEIPVLPLVTRVTGFSE